MREPGTGKLLSTMSRFVAKGLLYRITNNSSHAKFCIRVLKCIYTVPGSIDNHQLSITAFLGSWKKHPFSWCTIGGRQFLSGKYGVPQTFKQCAAQCDKTPGCKAIELWHKYNWNCYWCKRTDLIRPYINTRDLAYPAHVWVKRKKTLSLFYLYTYYIHLHFCISPMWIVHFKWHYIKMCISLNKAFQGNKLIFYSRIIKRNL